jgi:1,2-diacylglycerol 3-alpha-glucosyltransferase
MPKDSKTKKALIIWGNWGPYHYSRFRGFKSACADAGIEAIGLELFQKSNIYAWKGIEKEDGVKHFSFGDREMDFPILKCVTQLLPYLWKTRADYAFVPSYWHWSLFINLICRIRGAKIIMMNDSHADTEKARGLKRKIKAWIVKRFHAGFLAGKPQVRHFTNLGMKPESLFTGYDAIDVAYFSDRAETIRAKAEDERKGLNLPEKYFLSLSRMVEKKNLPRLVEAYADLVPATTENVPHLVFVGSGPTEKAIRRKAEERKLIVYDHTIPPADVDDIINNQKGVHFYGFRQIDENPVFFTLAEAFVMPSLHEEWGLVVNEALACATPVLVAQNAGCAEDLVIEGENGYKFDPNNTESITQSLEKMIAMDGNRYRMGKAGRKLIQNFDCESFGRNAMQAVKYIQSYK